MMLRLLIVGLISILGQVVLLRELAVSFYGIELIYVLGIGAWLLGTGAGAIFGSARFEPKRVHISALLLFFSVLLLLDVVFIRGMRHIFGGVSGAYLSFPLQIAGLAIAMIPAGIVAGLLFQWSAKTYLLNARTAAGAYAVESAGGVLGGLLSIILLMWGIPNSGTVLICAWIALIPLVTGAARERGERLLRIAALLFMAGFVFAYANVSDLDLKTARWNHPRVVFTRDTPYGRITAERSAEQLSVYENDALSFETEGTSDEEMAHLALLSHEQPQSVLILGGALEGMLSHILQHHPGRVDYVELNGRMVRSLQPMLAHDMQRSLTDSRVHFIEADPRRELERLGKYDVILVGISEPVSGQTNRFFTREFFQTAAAHLQPHGLLAFRLRSSENFWSEPLTLRNASVVRALEQVFRDRLILSGANYLVLAANDSLPRQPEALENRFVSRGIRARLVSLPYLRYLFANDRRAQCEARLAAVSAAANTDERPVCYHFAASIWLSKFYPALLKSGGLFAQNAKPWQIITAFALTAFVVIAVVRRWGSHTATLYILMAIVGSCGMILETVLLLRFQSVSGLLYQNIGLLLMLFMLGLTVGAGGMTRWAARRKGSNAKVNSIGMAVLAFLVLLAILIAWRMKTGGMTGIVEVGLALFLCGGVVAAIFGCTGAMTEKDPGRIIGPLYGADLIGGCLGSLVVSLILIPVAGLIWSAVLCALLAVVSTLALAR